MRNLFLLLLLSAFSISSVQAQIPDYNQDFETLDMSDPAALNNDGWLVFGNVFDPTESFLYQYGPFQAPNGGEAFSAIDNVVPGPNQEAQYLSVYNDYNNGDHGNSYWIEANVYQERILGPADLGLNYTFTFDHRIGNAALGDQNLKEAVAFVKVLDPNNGFALVDFKKFNALSGGSTTDWTEGETLTGVIDQAWNGHLIQFGFLSTCTKFVGSAVYYDNLSFVVAPPLEPIPTMSQWALFIFGLVLTSLGVVYISRRARSGISQAV